MLITVYTVKIRQIQVKPFFQKTTFSTDFMELKTNFHQDYEMKVRKSGKSFGRKDFDGNFKNILLTF